MDLKGLDRNFLGAKMLSGGRQSHLDKAGRRDQDLVEHSMIAQVGRPVGRQRQLVNRLVDGDGHAVSEQRESQRTFAGRFHAARLFRRRLDRERIASWLEKGTRPSEAVRQLIRRYDRRLAAGAPAEETAGAVPAGLAEPEVVATTPAEAPPVAPEE